MQVTCARAAVPMLTPSFARRIGIGRVAMTFEEILDQAIAMLQRQFQLDDAALEDLKDELIYGQRLATDEDGRVLVWTGGTAMTPATAPRAPQPAPQEASRSQGEASPTGPPPPDAERRHLT